MKMKGYCFSLRHKVEAAGRNRTSVTGAGSSQAVIRDEKFLTAGWSGTGLQKETANA